jgi:hypothetical protein
MAGDCRLPAGDAPLNGPSIGNRHSTIVYPDWAGGLVLAAPAEMRTPAYLRLTLGARTLASGVRRRGASGSRGRVGLDGVPGARGF